MTGQAIVGSEGAAVNQAQLPKMSEERLKDAQTLIDGSRWEFSYYAVECALKSCILARMIHTAWVFEDKWVAKDFRNHEFGKLVTLAGLTDQFNDNLKASAAVGGEFRDNWATAEKWEVTSRYEAKTEDEAKKLYAAIADEPHGVLRGIRTYW